MLQTRGVKHELLNAKPEYAPREAEIVAQAGRIGAVTIATNMAGRGTDIILGGNPEYLAWAQLKDKYRTAARRSRRSVEDRPSTPSSPRKRWRRKAGKWPTMGGLHIVGTERHEARRIDNQLRGRAGRQGDPGSSRFFLSLQDDLMRVFAGEWVASVLTRLGMEEGESIESRMVSRRIEAAQKKVEEKQLRPPQKPARIRRGEGPSAQARLRLPSGDPQRGQLQDRILDMIDDADRVGPDPLPGRRLRSASFAQLASEPLGVELDGGDFVQASYEEDYRAWPRIVPWTCCRRRSRS